MHLITDVPILMYHDLVPRGCGNLPYTIYIDHFESQLDYLERHGFKTMTVNELVSQLKTGVHPKRAVVLTFDDGLRSFKEIALPTLMRRKMKATAFIIGNRFAKKYLRKYMTETEVREVSDAGIEIGAHGWEHRVLPECSPEECEEELVRAKVDLYRITGKQVVSYAYPYGKHSMKNYESVQQAGYHSALALFTHERHVTSSLFALRRVNLRNGDNLFRFRLKLSKIYLVLRGRLVDRRVLAK
jgi:peptidoglycan/xylan/chitin deacetylase (PgdA/CDA1 family)